MIALTRAVLIVFAILAAHELAPIANAPLTHAASTLHTIMEAGR